MPLWGFGKDTENTVAGANTVAGLKYGFQPFGGATDGKEAWKRNVIATSDGWVRRRNITKDGGVSTRDEILVSANPGILNDGYANVAHLGFPEITQIYISSNSVGGNALQRSATANLYVVFNEPVRHKGGSGFIRVRLANTVSGNTLIATANAKSTTSASDIINANNTLVFKFVPGVAGTYKLNANTLAFASANGTGTFTSNLVSLNLITTGSESANLVIAGSVSNNFGTFTVRSATTGG
jgi:hypothetical protein